MEVRLIIREQAKWARFWRNLATLGELGKREAGLVMDAARRGLAQNWEQQRDPRGGAWAALRPFTQEEREKLGFPRERPILIRTGDLKDSFTEAGHPRNIADAAAFNGGTVMVVGARENPLTPGRIATLNYGGRSSMGMVPARPFIGFSETAQRQIEQQADNVLLARVGRLGG